MDMLDRQDAAVRLSRQDLMQVMGGRSVSGTLINAFNSAFKTIYGFGQDFGGAIRRLTSGKICPLCIRLR